MADYSDEWVFDNPDNRERYHRQDKEPTENVGCRVPQRLVRIMDEIAHERLDPRLKTKSDIMVDGIAMVVEDYVKNYADGISGRLLREVRMEMKERQYQAQERYLEKVDTMTSSARNLQDGDELVALLDDLKGEFDDSRDFAPKKYVEELRGRITTLEETLRREYIQ